MITHKSLSASKIKTYLKCPFSYYLSYVLRIRKPDSFATLNGRIIHSALEKYSLGHVKNWQQELLWRYKKRKPWLLHKHYGSHKVGCKGCQFTRGGFEHYHGSIEDLLKACEAVSKKCPLWHFKEAIDLIEDVLARNPNPLAYKLIDAEHRFELPIGGGFKINGIIDLVCEVEPGVLEIRDWKTGNWLPTYEEAYADPQLRLYDLAASILFPEYETRLLTLDYIKHKQYTFVFGDEERENNRQWLIEMGKKIENDMRPRRISSMPHKNFKCKYMCQAEVCKTQWPLRIAVLDAFKEEKG